MGNFWLHALSSSLISSSSSQGADFCSSLDSTSTRFAAASAAALRSSLFAPSSFASSRVSTATMASSFSLASISSQSALISSHLWTLKEFANSSTSSSPGWPTHPSARALCSRSRAFSLRNAFFCFSSSFLALALAALASSAAAAALAASSSAAFFAASSASRLPAPFAFFLASLASLSSNLFLMTRGSFSSARSTNRLILSVSSFFFFSRFFLFSCSICRRPQRSSADSRSSSSSWGNSRHDLNLAQNSYILRTFSYEAAGSDSMNLAASPLPSNQRTSDWNAGIAFSKKSSVSNFIGSFVGGASTESYTRRFFVSLRSSFAVLSLLNLSSRRSFSSSVVSGVMSLSGWSMSDRVRYATRIASASAR
mmetsp:Transcript_5255/g.23447  ORF Transcript_5255/g.23447 Transcript_5255/m.23447 type:complete len:368 (-) Transcript_5255:509-1612(-)